MCCQHPASYLLDSSNFFEVSDCLVYSGLEHPCPRGSPTHYQTSEGFTKKLRILHTSGLYFWFHFLSTSRSSAPLCGFINDIKSPWSSLFSHADSVIHFNDRWKTSEKMAAVFCRRGVVCECFLMSDEAWQCYSGSLRHCVRVTLFSTENGLRIESAWTPPVALMNSSVTLRSHKMLSTC